MDNNVFKSRFGAFCYLGLGFISVVGISGCSSLFQRSDQGNETLQLVRIAQTPFLDTTITLSGIEQGIFEKYGLEVEIVSTDWAGQFDILAGGGVDIAMTTLDSIVAKDRSLEDIGRRVNYALPAWQFLGLTFYSNEGIRTFDDFKSAASSEEEAISAFLDQFEDKIIAFPEGTIYQQAFAAFIGRVGLSLSDFRIVNTPLEAGLNGLEDSNVGMAAAALQERNEATRRGYSQAIRGEDLGLLVLTGFMTNESFDQENPDLAPRFVCGWYETVRFVKEDTEAAFDITSSYIDSIGGQAPESIDEYTRMLEFNLIPNNISETEEIFLDPASQSYWRIAWDGAVNDLVDTGNEGSVPRNTDAFIVPDILERSSEFCE